MEYAVHMAKSPVKTKQLYLEVIYLAPKWTKFLMDAVLNWLLTVLTEDLL